MTDMNADRDDVDATTDDASTTDTTNPEHDRGTLADLDDPGHLFDQTNGLADGLNGDSDGTADSDESSAAERSEAGTDAPPFNPDDRV